jgi:hypothetical protein
MDRYNDVFLRRGNVPYLLVNIQPSSRSSSWAQQLPLRKLPDIRRDQKVWTNEVLRKWYSIILIVYSLNAIAHLKTVNEGVP